MHNGWLQIPFWQKVATIAFHEVRCSNSAAKKKKSEMPTWPDMSRMQRDNYSGKNSLSVTPRPLFLSSPLSRHDADLDAKAYIKLWGMKPH